MVCSLFLRAIFTPAVGTISHLYIFERNKPTPVRRRLSLTKDSLSSTFQWFGVDVEDESMYAGAITLPCRIPFGFRPACHTGVQLRKFF